MWPHAKRSQFHFQAINWVGVGNNKSVARVNLYIDWTVQINRIPSTPSVHLSLNNALGTEELSPLYPIDGHNKILIMRTMDHWLNDVKSTCWLRQDSLLPTRLIWFTFYAPPPSQSNHLSWMPHRLPADGLESKRSKLYKSLVFVLKYFLPPLMFVISLVASVWGPRGMYPSLGSVFVITPSARRAIRPKMSTCQGKINKREIDICFR